MAGSEEARAIELRFLTTVEEFREAVDTALQNKDVESVVIELGGVEYLDSSALGMLLMLRDRAIAAKKSLSLANPRGMVKQALEIARFDKLFSIV